MTTNVLPNLWNLSPNQIVGIESSNERVSAQNILDLFYSLESKQYIHCNIGINTKSYVMWIFPTDLVHITNVLSYDCY